MKEPYHDNAEKMSSIELRDLIKYVEKYNDKYNDVLIMKKMNSIFIIPARKGSKGIPNKNTRIFFDKPLISYSIDCDFISL